MFQIKFKLPIVNDELIYKNPKKKSEGYSIKKGKSKVEDTQTISVGGRGKKIMKNDDDKDLPQNKSVTVE